MENLLYVSICSFSSFSLFLSLTRHAFFRQSESFGYFHRFITISSYYKKICNRKIDELLISRKPVRRHLERLIRQFLFFSFFFLSFFIFLSLLFELHLRHRTFPLTFYQFNNSLLSLFDRDSIIICKVHPIKIPKRKITLIAIVVIPVYGIERRRKLFIFEDFMAFLQFSDACVQEG